METNIYKALSLVMEDVGAVRKAERNSAQNFNFRGIDAVVNAVSPALRKHGVIVFPRLHSVEHSTVVIGQKQTAMGHVRVQVEYVFVASDGSNLNALVAAEAMDSGDKATAKAMSVAFRTALLQTLCLPTDETDPDHDVYERSSKVVEEKVVTKPSPQKVIAKPSVDPTGITSGGGLTKAQQLLVDKQVKKNFSGEDTTIVVGDIIKRSIASLSEVTVAEAQVLLPKLFGALE
jgi:hypothetical protein